MRSTLELPFFEPHHRVFAGEFSSWVGDHLQAFEAAEGGDGTHAACILERLARSGWLKRSLILQPTDSRGRLDVRMVCLMRDILGHSSAMADVAFSEPWLAAIPILLRGSPTQTEMYVSVIGDGRCLPAFALSEPEAGSDVAAIQCTATPVDGGWVLNGRKTWTSNAGIADLYVVFARTPGRAGAAGLSTYLVEGKNPGVRLCERLDVMPPHTVGTLEFKDCFVRADMRLGEEGQGFATAMTALELFRPTVGAATLGFARRALAEAVKRSTERVTFRKPIAEHQMIQGKLADMSVAVEAAALCVYRAAWGMDCESATRSRDASIAKLFASEAAQRVVDEALQIFGGMGVVHGTVVERLYRHVRAFRIFDGTSEIQRLIIAKHLLSG
jgi:acyl-CoA dehydrogenase